MAKVEIDSDELCRLEREARCYRGAVKREEELHRKIEEVSAENIGLRCRVSSLKLELEEERKNGINLEIVDRSSLERIEEKINWIGMWTHPQGFKRKFMTEKDSTDEE